MMHTKPHIHDTTIPHEMTLGTTTTITSIKNGRTKIAADESISHLTNTVEQDVIPNHTDAHTQQGVFNPDRHAASLLLSISLLPLADLVSCVRTCRSWYSIVSSDSQELAWSWQREQERRKYRLASSKAEKGSSSTRVVHVYSYGDFNPEALATRSALLRATPNAYFLKNQKEDLPLMSSTPLLLHLRSLSLSLHCNFPRIYASFINSFLHLTSLEIICTNLYPLDEAAIEECMRTLGSKQRPLWELRLKFSDVSSRPGSAGSNSSKSNGSSARASPTRGVQHTPENFLLLEPEPPLPNYLASNFLILTRSIRWLKQLRFLSVEGVTNELDQGACDWLSRGNGEVGASPISSSSATKIPCFPHLLRLSLPSGLSKTAQRIYHVRLYACKVLDELVWPDWSSLVSLELMLFTPAAQDEMRRRREMEKRGGKEHEFSWTGAAESTTASTALIQGYIPPPLRLPAPTLHSFSLDGLLTTAHLQLLHLLARPAHSRAGGSNGLKSLDITNWRPFPGSAMMWLALKEFTGCHVRHDEDAEEKKNHASSISYLDPDLPSPGLESLSLSSSSWSFPSLLSLQSCGTWRSLKRLRLACPSPSPNPFARPVAGSCHNLSVANSSFHPGTFFRQLGLGSPLNKDSLTVEELWFEGMELGGLGCIFPPLPDPSWSRIRSLTLSKVQRFGSRTLTALKNAAFSLRHLVLDQVEQLLVEDLVYLLPDSLWNDPSKVCAEAKRSIEAAEIGYSTLTTPGVLQLESLHFCPEAIPTRLAYLRKVRLLPEGHPFAPWSNLNGVPFQDHWVHPQHHSGTGEEDMDLNDLNTWTETCLKKWAQLAAPTDGAGCLRVYSRHTAKPNTKILHAPHWNLVTTQTSNAPKRRRTTV